MNSTQSMKLNFNYEIGSTNIFTFHKSLLITCDDILEIKTSEAKDEYVPEEFEIGITFQDSTKTGIDTRIWVKPNDIKKDTIWNLVGTNIDGMAKSVNAVIALIICSYKINIEVVLSKGKE